MSNFIKINFVLSLALSLKLLIFHNDVQIQRIPNHDVDVLNNHFRVYDNIINKFLNIREETKLNLNFLCNFFLRTKEH